MCVCVRGCVGGLVRGCVGAWVRGCVGVWVCGCGCVFVCVCVRVRVYGAGWRVARARQALLILDKFQATTFQDRIGRVLRQAPASEPACGHNNIQATVVPAPAAFVRVVSSALSRLSENGPGAESSKMNHKIAVQTERDRERERDNKNSKKE